MATTLVFTVSAYTPFTKIASADINQDKADIKARINWAGGTSATTGLGDDNIQSTTASGGGLTRATKLKAGTVNHVVINDSLGAMSSEAALATSRGGLGVDFNALTKTINDVITWNGTQFTSAPSPVSPVSRPSLFNRFSF